jgi:hypothetical protein
VTEEEDVSATRTTATVEEQAALEQLGRLFGVIDHWQTADAEQGGLFVQPGSPLAADDRITNPLQVSHAAIHGIATAVDHLHSLRMLIQTAEALHTFAPFTLCRAAIEGAATAIWVLSPPSRDERIRRRLVLENMNVRDADGAITAMGGTSSLEDRLDRIQEIARRRPPLDPNGIVGSPPGLKRIVQEAGAAFELGSKAALICWQACSGITHSRLWASINLLDREELGRVANVRNLRMTASFKNVTTVTAISVAFSAEARRLFAMRAIDPARDTWS